MITMLYIYSDLLIQFLPFLKEGGRGAAAAYRYVRKTQVLFIHIIDIICNVIYNVLVISGAIIFMNWKTGLWYFLSKLFLGNF